MVDRDPNSGIQRRVAGYHDVRMDGMCDLLLRCRGWSVLDLGCNRGMVGFEFACNGARLVHGCDSDSDAILVAQSVFADIRSVSAKFAVVDLSGGSQALTKAFGEGEYDCVLLFAVVHKLERVMSTEALESLLIWLGRHATKYVAARLHPPQEHYTHQAFRKAGLGLVHRSYLADDFGYGSAWIWQRGYSGPEPI
jgi:SAM-dependent methyltransferase